ncbi:MAG: hypothetical protein GF334_12870 [Candidatus Altiarchaeales archaeon]|nr:hypothetical protein [Candidatus Altiarchaeales archaeon]
MIRVASEKHLKNILLQSFLPLWEGYQRQVRIHKVARRMLTARNITLHRGGATIELASQAVGAYAMLIKEGLEAEEVAGTDALEEREKLLLKGGVKPLIQEKHFLNQEGARYERFRKAFVREFKRKKEEAENNRLFKEEYVMGPDGLPIIERNRPKTKGRPERVFFLKNQEHVVAEAFREMRNKYFIPWIREIGRQRASQGPGKDEEDRRKTGRYERECLQTSKADCLPIRVKRKTQMGQYLDTLYKNNWIRDQAW